MEKPNGVIDSVRNWICSSHCIASLADVYFFHWDGKEVVKQTNKASVKTHTSHEDILGSESCCISMTYNADTCHYQV